MNNLVKLNKNIAIVGSNSIHTIRYIKSIAPYFKQIIFITNSTPTESTEDTWPLNIQIYTIDFRVKHFSSHKKIAYIFLKHDINLVHIHQANSYAYHTIKATKRNGIKVKIILTTWGSDILVLPKVNMLFKLLVKYNLAHSDIITSDSLYMSSEITRLVSSVKELHTINYGIQNLPAICNSAQKENIIFSNRLHKTLYNIDKIILGFNQFIKQNPNSNYKLVIAADGIETNNLKQLVEKLEISNCVTFLGMIGYNELVTWYAKAKIFISIPNTDGTSMSLLEAMSYGCYPILSNIPANLEWVIDDLNGRICQNSTQLVNDIHQAIGFTSDPNKLDDIIKFNHDLIKQKGVFRNNLNKFIELYSK